jgi:hypothetical protein
MNPLLAGSAQMFRISDFYLRQSVRGLGPEHLTRRTRQANSILWTAAHVAVGRLRLLVLLGELVEIPWVDVAGRGADEDVAALPDLSAVLACWLESATRLGRRLEQLSDADLVAPAHVDLPGSDGTVLGTVNYFAFHEAYHIGQMAVLRKALGEALPRRTVDRVIARSGSSRRRDECVELGE